jgi:hypothetical protein
MGELPHTPASIFGGDGSPRQLDDIRQLLHPKTAEAIPALQKDIQNDVGPDPAELARGWRESAVRELCAADPEAVVAGWESSRAGALLAALEAAFGGGGA